MSKGFDVHGADLVLRELYRKDAESRDGARPLSGGALERWAAEANPGAFFGLDRTLPLNRPVSRRSLLLRIMDRIAGWFGYERI